jgi:hypothetical protein
VVHENLAIGGRGKPRIWGAITSKYFVWIWTFCNLIQCWFTVILSDYVIFLFLFPSM